MPLSLARMARMDALLHEALPLDADGRRRWLEALAPEDRDLEPALRQGLLSEGGQAANTLDTLPKTGAGTEVDLGRGGPQPGELIGPYRLEGLLGQGGMAEVWLAQRADGAFRREVALKLPRLGGLRQDLASRFERERDILAGLEHPNIARLYDAGVTAEGLSYLAMEYVHGEPLTAWCDRQHLGIRERLRLFLQVLEAVQYAHEHRVIHRDIKPSNILVTEAGQVRLLDFGVAKLLEQEGTALTRVYGRALTPEYASPELARGEAVAASDLYALGVVLYEVLAGSRPYSVPTGASVRLLEQALATAEVPPPSTQLGKDAGTVRSTTPKKLARRLRGDLDAIVLKALAKRPEDRYASAEALADELQRYLSGEPVQARRGALADRLGKFVLRHRSGFATGVLIAVLGAYAVTHRQQQVPTPEASKPAAFNPIPATAPVDVKSIAVLPFVNMSADKEQDYFSDGLTEELIDRLSHSPDLKVIARTSSFAFKGKNEDIRSVAAKLGVTNLLEGSVRKSGNALRITAQLIRATDGVHLWSQTYERKLSDIFKVQDEIAKTVAQALSAVLTENRRLHQNEEANTEVYALLLQGNFFYARRTKADVDRAIEFFKKAIDADPNYALAWSALATAYRQRVFWGWTSRADGVAAARRAAQRALQIDPNLSSPHAVLGDLLVGYDWNWSEGKAELERAIELDPQSAVARTHLLAITDFIQGRPSGETFDYLRKVVARDPLDTASYWLLGWSLFNAGRPEESVTAFQSLLELNPVYAGGQAGLGAALLFSGRYSEALDAVTKETDENWRLFVLPSVYWALGRRADSDATLRQLKEKYAPMSAWMVANVYAYRGETDAALEWLDRAYRQHESFLSWVKLTPWLRSLHDDPRYRAFLLKMNLPA